VDNFITMHRKGAHIAIFDGKIIIKDKPTEVDLVRALKRIGVSLYNYRYETKQLDGYDNTIHWSKK